MLSAGERHGLNKRVRGVKTAYRDRLRAQIVLAAARGHPNARIAAGWHQRRYGPQVAGPVRARGLDGLTGRPRPGRRGGSARRTGPRWSRWPASCPPRPGCRRAGGPARKLAAELAPGAGRPMPASSVLRILASTRSSRGSTSRRSIPRPGLRGQGEGDRGPVPGVFTRASRSEPVTGSCPSTPSRRSMPAAAGIPPCPPRPAGPSATSTSTSAKAPSRCWPAWTCTPGRCSPPPPSPPGSSRSWTSPAGHGPSRYNNAPRVFVIAGNGPDHRGQAAISRLGKAHPNAIIDPYSAARVLAEPDRDLLLVIQKRVVLLFVAAERFHEVVQVAAGISS